MKLLVSILILFFAIVTQSFAKFLAGVYTSAHYEIYAENGLLKTEFPRVGEFSSNGSLVFRIHKGGLL